MKTLKKIFLFAFIGTLFVTCKKELPAPTVQNQPVFSFAGTINGNNVNWQAGVNNYYMYSNYTQNTSGVYSFNGTLQSTSTAANSIQILINDYKASSVNASAVIDSSLVPAYYSYNIPGGNSTKYSVVYIPVLGTGVPSTYAWTFGDGAVSNTANPTHVYNHPGDYRTSLTVKFDSGCTTTDSNIFKMGTPDASTHITAINVSNAGGPVTNMKFSPLYTGTVKKCLWEFGDGHDTTINNADSVIHQYTNQGMYLVTLIVTDVNGNVSVYNENIVTVGYTTDCDVNYGTVISPATNPLSLSNITINYTDGGGNVYTSNSTSQGSGSSFQVLSVSPYQNNSSGNSTKMLKVSFTCDVFNSSANPSIIAISGTAIIAVAYPQ